MLRFWEDVTVRVFNPRLLAKKYLLIVLNALHFQHYIGHGYVAYHCAYCSYANQDQNDVKKHLIDFHPDDPPKCYARIPKVGAPVCG